MEGINKDVEITVSSDDEEHQLVRSTRESVSSSEEAETRVSSEEMDELSTSMLKSLSSARPHSRSNKCCIYKVPEYILKHKEDFYLPKVISIGPVFYKQERLEAMQELKWIYLETFLQHPKNENRSLKSYIDAIRKLKDDIHGCYQDQTIMLPSGDGDDDEFIKMIVLDAAFLLCFFMTNLASTSEFALESDPPVPRKLQQSFQFMDTDLLLLENQLPFFVLVCMFELAFPDEPTSELVDIACIQIETISIPGGKYLVESETPDNIPIPEIAHLLDLYIRYCNLHLGETAPLYAEEPMRYPGTAKQLSAAGVKFKRSQNLNLLCIEFDEDTGELFIPHIDVNKKTEASLRNLLHFENCHYYTDHHSYFGDLIYFLDSLIDTAGDIHILRESGIIQNILGSDEMAAALFNNLTANIMARIYCNHYSDVSKRVIAYANKPWNRWMAILRSDYFAHPWAIISFIVAILFFVLTVIQTVSNFTGN